MRGQVLRGLERGPWAAGKLPVALLLVLSVSYYPATRLLVAAPGDRSTPGNDLASTNPTIVTQKGGPYQPKHFTAPNRLYQRAQATMWAAQPLKPVRLPEVALAAWVQTPVDRFVLARLEKSGLKPSAAANRETLIRRLSFDLTGLPKHRNTETPKHRSVGQPRA